jgi:hypothetical protein
VRTSNRDFANLGLFAFALCHGRSSYLLDELDKAIALTI